MHIWTQGLASWEDFIMRVTSISRQSCLTNPDFEIPGTLISTTFPLYFNFHALDYGYRRLCPHTDYRFSAGSLPFCLPVFSSFHSRLSMETLYFFVLFERPAPAGLISQNKRTTIHMCSNKLWEKNWMQDFLEQTKVFCRQLFNTLWVSKASSFAWNEFLKNKVLLRTFEKPKNKKNKIPFLLLDGIHRLATTRRMEKTLIFHFRR